jgi:hypothetical protein
LPVILLIKLTWRPAHLHISGVQSYLLIFFILIMVS